MFRRRNRSAPRAALSRVWSHAGYEEALALLDTECPPDTNPLIWVEERFGLIGGTPLFEAAETRKSERTDAQKGGWESRGARFQQSRTICEAQPAAIATFLPLGERLFDAGELAPPYDEYRFADDFERDGLMQYDPGPRRLDRLITLAQYAAHEGHPRAGEWQQAAEAAAASIVGMRMGSFVEASIARLR